MIRAEDTALILLAAGRSSRFGAEDKLAEPFLREPLAFHAVTALAAVPFLTRIAVVSDTCLDFAARGYRVVHNPDPTLGQARSVCFGVEAARQAGADAVLVALADMPRVTAAHIYRLLDAARGSNALVASSDGVNPCPPALFGADHFDTLLNLSGDQGARALIRRGRHIITSPAELIDIDTPEDLERLRADYGVARRREPDPSMG